MKIGKPAVWIVDDDPDDQLLIQAAFREFHPAISVTSLTTFGALLAHIGQVNLLPNLLLVDLNMPGITGFEVVHYLRRRAAYNQLPIIILTDLEERMAQQKALALGAAEFLIKPFSYPELGDLVAQLVSRWSLSTEEVQSSHPTIGH